MPTALARVALVKKPIKKPVPRRKGPSIASARDARNRGEEAQTPQARPFIKWVGGKGRLLTQLEPLLPPNVDQMRHVEPFMGGAALFFAQRPRRALLCDLNPHLVSTYIAIRDELPAVVRHLRKLKAKHCQEEFYVRRTRYNTKRLSPAERAATFIYLNKTCFNGLHRVNRKGEFNVPCGRYKNPRILDEQALSLASAQLKTATIACQGFDSLLRRARKGDFVYMDPPYAPVSATSNFTSYASDGFDAQDQRRLRDVYEVLDARGCKLMLSNSDVPFIRDLYRNWRIDVVRASRAINSKASGRGKVNEVVVRNY